MAITKKQTNWILFLFKRRPLVLIYATFLLSVTQSFGQQAALKFDHFGKQEGLNQSSVNFIFQDYQNYVWVANFGGVNKFDGYDFTSYVNDFEDQHSISDNSVWTIYEREDHSLWFGTKSGLSRYNQQNNNFTNFYIQNPTETATGTVAVKSLFEDKTGRFYIGSEGEGLFIFSLEKEAFVPIKLIPNNAKISAITEDLYGCLWVGTENNGLFRISEDRTAVDSYFQSNVLSITTIWSLLSDEFGNTWIGTDKDGLIRYNDEDAFVSCKSFLNAYYKGGEKIKTIAKDNAGKLWIGSATKGLSSYDYQKRQFFNYTKNPYDNNSLFDTDVSSIYCGKNNVLYVGFYMKGFDKVIPTPFLTIKNDPENENSLSNNNVYCMYTDSEDILWFGTFGGGLNRYDSERNKFKTFQNDKNDPSSISHDWVRIIYEDKNKTMWIGTWGGGLNKFDRKTETFTHYLPAQGKNNSLNLNIVTAVFEDADGELWVGTYGGGINIYQPETDDFKAIVHNKNNPNSLSDDHITSFYQDEDGIIWICTYGGGLNAYNKKTNVFERFLPDNKNEHSLNTHKVLHIFDEPDSNFFWLTTLGGGINKFYPNEGKFFNYTERNGLANNSTMGMLKDQNGHYWVSSNNGLSHFNPYTETFTNYTTIDGLASDDYNLEAYTMTKDGTMYFGGKMGITYFNPKNIITNASFPSVAFTKVKVEDSLQNNLEKVQVAYRERVTFDFVAINANKTSNIEYAYQLIGQDKDWHPINKVRHLEYSSLPPGEYELRVKSTNGNKIWNEKYTSIFIVIVPPWYMTWFFRITAVLFILISIYSYYRMKLNRAKKQNKLLEQKVEDRTKTIQEKNIALGTEKEKTDQAYKQLKKLEGFKDELTSMIVHDLKNPLVTILTHSAADSSTKNLKRIHKSGNMMLDLIENMLDVQKFENTVIELKLEKTLLNTVVTEAINHIEVLATEKRIAIVHILDPTINVNIDASIIHRVLINLLTNAIKFSPTDSKIEINTSIDEMHPTQVKIEVKDYGKGIKAEMLPFIFDRFSQAEAIDSGNIKSTGLGLTFCKMAIELHKEKIGVESIFGKGTRFFFTLPRSENELTQDNVEIVTQKIYKNELLTLKITHEDLVLLAEHLELITKLSLYETGEWLEIFERLEGKETENIKKWKDLMMETLTSFDEKAFDHLKNILHLKEE